MANGSMRNTEVNEVWERYQNGEGVPQIARLMGLKITRVANIINAIEEVDPEDIEDMRADRAMGMTESELEEKYGFINTAIRFYTHDVETTRESSAVRGSFVEEWNRVCRWLNPRAWEGRE